MYSIVRKNKKVKKSAFVAESKERNWAFMLHTHTCICMYLADNENQA